ncbi:MAG: reverse transcriptase-like protein [Caldilineaceae bacterium SB0661_bin_32]|uniref:Reverse transcriptase-like protein n=1 Tax=Caldilineaceae bacterium SB0661_bin_32 TaxID=2605255 RepID=A0A6B1DA32_9CHLR|nr:reverse transcriptase-like protein [Caldilineaceae bacterium SB0661_bin_32]
MGTDLERLVNQIGRLSTGQRRLLFRQLKALGLIEAEELLSDRNPLNIALSVSAQNFERSKRQIASGPVKPRPPEPADRPQKPDRRSPDSGNQAASSAGQMSEMQPPAPSPQEETPIDPIQIVFDGGSRGNPGEGYGSFALDWPGYPREIVQLNFGDNVTNNEAEYDTLIAALEAVRDRMKVQLIDPGSAILSIWGDSLLVCNQVRGEWGCKEPRLQVRLEKVRALLSGFGECELNHHPREKSVEILGH